MILVAKQFCSVQIAVQDKFQTMYSLVVSKHFRQLYGYISLRFSVKMR